MDKEDVYTMEYYSATRKMEILLFVKTWMELEGFMLSEVSQTEKDKYSMLLLIGRILKRKWKSNS